MAELQAEAALLVFGSPAPRAVGHTDAISSVVVPGRTSSIAASSHSRHCLYASSCDCETRADVERAVVARPVAHERVDDVEERLVARAQQPVGEDVRMRVAAVARDGVDRLDLLGAQLEEELLRARDDLVLVHARAEHAVDLLVDRVDDPAGVVEERDLLVGLDLPRLEHHARAVGDVDAGALQRLDRDQVGHVDPERLARRGRARAARSWIFSASRSGMPVSSGIAPRIGATPARKFSSGSHGAYSWWCRAAEPKSQRIGSCAAREQHPARVLVARPLADVRARDVADVVRVEQQQRTEVGGLERRLRPREPVGAQLGEVDPLLPVDRHRGAARCDVRRHWLTCPCRWWPRDARFPQPAEQRDEVLVRVPARRRRPRAASLQPLA